MCRCPTPGPRSTNCGTEPRAMAARLKAPAKLRVEAIQASTTEFTSISSISLRRVRDARLLRAVIRWTIRFHGINSTLLKGFDDATNSGACHSNFWLLDFARCADENASNACRLRTV